jgi:predicted nucleic acid-binding protein
MIVVSNTSPLNYLVLTDVIEVLPSLYGEVYVPPMVLDELAHPGSPLSVRTWVDAPPLWLVVQAPVSADMDLPLHPGEVHAIALAQELDADLILIDERAGREAARSLGVMPIGTLGVLYEAAGRGLLDLPGVLRRLTTETSFRCSRQLIDDLLSRDADRLRRDSHGEDRR